MSVLLKEHFHTDTTTLIHDLTFDVFTFKGIILKQLIQGIAFKDYTSCQMTKELSYGSEYNRKRRPVYRVRFPLHELAKNMYHVYLDIYIPFYCAQLTVLYASDQLKILLA